jgi:phage terminase large subunit-like protein|tara:strand:+ start:2520 stop:3812 length:1293 start_codon:yes stop_codon:yes gene_type:complete
VTTELTFKLHQAQQKIFTSPKRFKVVGAGRRFGKSYLARVELIIKALEMKNEYGYDLSDKACYYIAPTFNQAKDIMWQSLKQMAAPITEKVRENECILTLTNGRQIYLKGSDRPETLRGVGLSYVVMDEYAFMKEDVWTAIIRPTLADVRGGGLFIGTPNGKNHFYDLFLSAGQADEADEWGAWTFKSLDNPFLDPKEVVLATKDMPLEFVKQEFEANFSSFGGTVFTSDLFEIEDKGFHGGDLYMTVDPAGYGDVKGIAQGKIKRLDETAISVVEITTEGWHCHEIITGRWNVRETAVRILRAAQKYKPRAVGIERGALKNALMPYLQDNMRRLNTYPYITELSHGNQKKYDRIVWALQGRMEQGRLTFQPGAYTKKLLNQLLDFPNPLAHDDMMDSLAYIDQIGVTPYDMDQSLGESEWEPMDLISGL